MVRPTQEGRVLPLTATQSTPGTDAGGEDLDWDSSSSAAAIIVEESDGYPTVPGVDTLIFDSAGFLVTDNADGSVSVENLGGSAIGSVTDGTTTVDPATSLVVPPLGVVDDGGGEARLRFLTDTYEGAAISVVASSGAAQDLDCTLANVFVLTLDDDCVLTVSNPPPSGVAGRIWVVLIQGGAGGFTVTWPAEFVWQAADGTNTGDPPTLYTAVDAQDVIQASTIDGGTTWGASSERVTGGATALADLTDVNLDYLADGDMLAWDEASGFWVNVPPPSGSVPDGTDPGDLLAWDGDSWAVLPISTNDYVLTADDGEALGVKWAAASGSITTADATLANDVTMTNANQFYDGPSASLAAGTWLIWYKAVFALATTGQTHDVTIKLWDATNIFDESSNGFLVNNTSGTIGYEVSGFGKVTLAGTTTVKISACDIRASSVMKKNVTSNSGTSNTATRMTAMKVA